MFAASAGTGPVVVDVSAAGTRDATMAQTWKALKTARCCVATIVGAGKAKSFRCGDRYTDIDLRSAEWMRVSADQVQRLSSFPLHPGPLEATL